MTPESIHSPDSKYSSHGVIEGFAKLNNLHEDNRQGMIQQQTAKRYWRTF